MAIEPLPHRLSLIVPILLAACILGLGPAHVSSRVLVGTKEDKTTAATDGTVGSLPKTTTYGSYTEEAEADRVTSLPGWGAVTDFNLFSG